MTYSFMIAFENIRPSAPNNVSTPWFIVVPNSYREKLTASFSGVVKKGPNETAFLIARGLTSGVFILVALTIAWRAMQRDDPTAWLQAAFLTIAWFWLLCPTQNPWYWTWVLPMIAFARNRIWIAFGCVVFVYYTRFWFGAMYGDQMVLGTRYQGATFFDMFAPWLQFAPLLLALAVTSFMRLRLKHSA